MGLDIFLRHCSNLDAEIALQDEAERLSEENWNALGKKYDDLNDEEKEAIREKNRLMYESMGLDIHGSSKHMIGVEHDSVTAPDHLFKVGYLRSCYNEGGINSVMTRNKLPTLYDIFGVNGEEYYVKPDWSASLQRAEAAIVGYRAHLMDPMSRFDVMTICSPIFEGVPDAAAAMELFKKERQKYEETKNSPYPMTSYGNREGDYFMEGTKAYGFIANSGYGGGFHVVYEKDSLENIEDEWYLQALKITKETIEYVLSQPEEERGNYCFGWSG